MAARGQRDFPLRYASSRSAVFILGAGASASAGLPMQVDLLPKALQKPEITGSAVGSEIVGFLERFFTFSQRTPEQMPSLETIFAFLDYFISRDEHLSSEFTVERLRHLQDCLVRVIHAIIGERRGIKESAHRRFWENVGRLNRNVTIISLNYDSVIEEAFDCIYARQAYIDYCLNLLNYDFAHEMGFNWWVNPREPVRTWDEGVPTPIKILKLHGSLNWKYCRACRRVLLTPWDTEIEVDTGAFFDNYVSMEEAPMEYLCPIDGCRFEALIIPPAYVKDLRHPVVTTVVSEAEHELRVAEKVVFVDYSFPDADVHVRALLGKCLPEGVEVMVVNPDTSDALKSRYAHMSRSVVFVEKTFDQFVDSGLTGVLKSAGA